MPLTIRPYEPGDEAPLRARFSGETRPPWIALPHPYSLERLLQPKFGLTVFVAESSRAQVVGLIAIDDGLETPQLIGPLVPDEQLADLIGLALLKKGLEWAENVGLPGVRVKLDLDEDRGIALFINQGFRVLPERQYVLSSSREPIARPLAPPPGLKMGPAPEMVSSDYLKLYRDIGSTLGWHERLNWTRSQIFEHLQRGGLHLLAARHDDAYVGFAEIEESRPGEGELVHFGLLPAYQDPEVEGPFLQYVLQWAADTANLKRLWTTVNVTDSEARVAMLIKAGLKKERAMVVLEKALGERAKAEVGAV